MDNKVNQKPKRMQDGDPMYNQTVYEARGRGNVINVVALLVLLCASAYVWTFKKRKR